MTRRIGGDDSRPVPESGSEQKLQVVAVTVNFEQAAEGVNRLPERILGILRPT